MVFNQRYLTPKMKDILVQWLNEIRKEYDIDTTIFFYSLKLLRKFEKLVNDIRKDEYQLVGCVILNLALKFLDDEEIIPIETWCELSSNSFDKEKFIGMEMFVLQNLNYNIYIM